MKSDLMFPEKKIVQDQEKKRIRELGILHNGSPKQKELLKRCNGRKEKGLRCFL